MVYPILQGIAYGVVMAFMIGPVFFTLLRTSIDRGIRSGVMLAAGISISEAFIIAVCYAGIAILDNNLNFQSVMGVLGGLLMMSFGIAIVLKSRRPEALIHKPESSTRETRNHYIRCVAEGFLLNVLNPFVYIFWIGIVGATVIKTNYDISQTAVLFGFTVLTVFLTDVGKVYISHHISQYLTGRTLSLIDRFVGLALMSFGLYLFYFGVFGETVYQTVTRWGTLLV
jgi:threonine/homoserine/homoserine lactone efflux protein